MAYNKDTDLTAAQELFVQEVVKGKSQYAAMLVAYPKRVKWARESTDTAAAHLMANNKVKTRYQELLKIHRQKEEDKTSWTREQSINTSRYLIDVGKRELDRIEQAYEDEVDELMKKMMNPELEEKERQKIYEQLQSKRKSRRIGMTAVTAINNGLNHLNKMQGYDNLNITVTTNTEQKNMEALTPEELRAIAKANAGND